ncbi:MAG TPA: glycoside hydrolase family 20 zincin-like fold domain-containing protein, partial [Acidimicrobiales bacterium]|nr:glycoside hydrolase family 20 zincin-like fold domain-containing protein [Acidimicrobiales bacterium]
MPNPPLFPRPRRLEGYDESLAARIVTPTITRDPALPAQGYELRIDADGARLTHADEAGRRYGEATLAQLRRADGSLPGVHVVDWPDFVHRGYMLDVSRDRVPTRATLERLVERLAMCRYNQLQLYIEHTFAYSDHETVWADASPITPDDLRWLDDRCTNVGIELVVNQNTFGHFERWLAHPEYRQRAECPDGFEIVPGVTLPPSVLAPTADNATIAVDLVRAQQACVTSRTVNVGCDETFELGHGVSAPRAAADGLAAVYAEHLHRIIDPLVEDGMQVQFWGDVARTHPEILDTFPTGRCTPLVWNYDAPDVARPGLPAELRDVLATIGIDPDAPTDFATILEPFAAAGHPFWVAPGTSSWQSFIGRLPNARGNLEDAAVAGRDAGATGYLVTDWGDQGHHQPPAVS